MSKSSASVAVSALFNILIWVAPGIPDRSRFVIFCVTAALFVAACIWWAVAHWSKPKTQPVTTSAYAHRPAVSNVATAGRDVHQMIYHAGAPQTPQITFTITADYTCYSDNQWASGPVRFLHAKVSIDHGSVMCLALLTKIAKGHEVKWEHGPEQLTFGDHTPGDPLPRRLHHGFEYNLDVLVIDCKTNEIQVCNDRRHWLRRPRMHEIFAEKGDYILTIGLAGDGAESRTVELRFNWTGNWQTSFLKSNGGGSSNHAPLRPIQIRDALDRFIRDAERLLEQWNPANDAITASEVERQTLDWMTNVEGFVKSNLDVRHLDQLKNYGKTVKAYDRRIFSFNLANRGIVITTHPVAYELAFKIKVLEYFRDEIR